MSIRLSVNATEIARAFIKEYESRGSWMHKDQMIEWFNQHKVEYIAHGGTRVCVGINDNYVLKIALGKEYRFINEAECDRYNEMDDEQKRHYTEIFRHGKDFNYLLVERVIPNIGDDQMPVPDEVCELIDDNWGFNFGRRKNGEWVALDYADTW